MTGPFELEPLENRKHLSATLSSHDVLYVVGTPHSDAITFELERRHPGVLNVTINGAAARFYMASVHSIVLENGRGDDHIVFDDRYGKIPGQPQERRHHHDDDFVANDDETEVTVDNCNDTSNDDSMDDTSTDDGSNSSTQPTTQPTDEGSSDDGSDAGDDSGDSGDGCS